MVFEFKPDDEPVHDCATASAIGQQNASVIGMILQMNVIAYVMAS